MSLAKNRLGFIGAGRMATALASGFVSAGLVEKAQIVASDPVAGARDAFAEATGGRIAADNRQVTSEADVLFLAVKPQQMCQVLSELHGNVGAGHLVVSIAAGTRLETLSKGLGEGPRIVRVMPNTPCLVGESASAYCLGPGACEADGRLVGELLGAVGTAYELDEKLMDAVTGLSGSGPAFVYIIIEALSDGGVQMGLPRDVALTLAAQTVKGAAQMVLATGEHPAVLKDRVASPGGTTIAGIEALESHGLRAALISAVEAATRRSEELSRT